MKEKDVLMPVHGASMSSLSEPAKEMIGFLSQTMM